MGPATGQEGNGEAAPSGGLVAAVEPESPAASAGVMPGDRILSIDGQRLRDVIDYQFIVEPVKQEVELERDGDILKLEIDNHGHDYPGIIFGNTLFDGVRRCRCNCAFCFVDQVPSGLRDALFIKDDDYRLSFLYGNFVTLNNLEPGDRERIIEQRLSPLYVSVHATDPKVRAGLMGCSQGFAQAGIDNLRLLGGEGIEAHIQVVLCPGINDGEVLARTVTDLAGFPGVASVGVVPVAVPAAAAGKAGGARVAVRPLSDAECRQVVAAVGGWQESFRQERGYGFVYAADELYLRAGAPLPPVGDYDELPQYENGIGIAASFRQEAGERLRPLLADIPADGRVYLLTGTLARPFLEETLKRLREPRPGWLAGRDITMLTAVNHLFGEYVTVTGLLGGRDVIAAARAACIRSEDTILMPASALDSSGERFLDDLTLAELTVTLGCAVIVV